MKIASWNVNSFRVRLPQVLTWLETHQPDVLALQETKVLDPLFPIDAVIAAGYHPYFVGQKTYNGVALLSREPLTDVLYQNPCAATDTEKRFLCGYWRDTAIVNVYVPNGGALDSEKYPYKLAWLSELAAFLSQQLSRTQKVCVLGDFNIAPDDRDVHDPALWEGSVLVSPAERAALQQLFALGLSDVFRAFEQPENAFSWWDYRGFSFPRNRGLRIDLILASTALAERCVEAGIDVLPRRDKQPSDHAPVFAVFE